MTLSGSRSKAWFHQVQKKGQNMRLDDYGFSLSLSLFLILSFFCIDGVIEDRRRIGMLLLTALNQMKKKTTMVLFIVCYDSEFL